MSENNGWIKCSERLPEPLQTDHEYRSEENKHIIYYTEDGDYWLWMVFIRPKRGLPRKFNPLLGISRKHRRGSRSYLLATITTTTGGIDYAKLVCRRFKS